MKRWRWRACAVAVGLLGLNCTDSTGPRSFAGRFAFAPQFVSSTAGIVAFDRARITVVQAAPPNAEVLDTIIAIPATADSIDLSLSVPMSSAKEDMLLYLRLVNAADDTVFRNSPYPQQVTVTTGGAPAVVAAPIVYVGVGYDAAAVTIGTPDTSVLFGDTLHLTATAWNSQDQAIPGTPIAWRSLDSVRVKVPNAAVAKVVGGSQRGPAKIVAELLTGQADTITVTAVPLPTTLLRVSGDSQTATPLAALPLPLRVRVLGSDGLGVQTPVLFRALTSGASVSADTVVSDSLGYAQVTGTLGPAVGAQGFDARVNGIATPVTFSATAVSGTVASVTLDRTVDTIARGAGLQYNAVARDTQGNPVSVTIGWTATVPAVATVNTTGLVVAVGTGFSQIIAAAAGHADTALLYVRALDSVAVFPSDTVVTAIGDSFDLRATAYDNFGKVLTTGFTQKFTSATPTVATVNANGRVTSVGAGNGVIIVSDSVDPTLKVQAAATVRVNQVTASITNTPALPDSLQVGVNGRRAIIAQALDRNSHPIPNKTFGYRSADPAVASVDAAGIVTGLQLNGTTFVIDSVDGFKDSVKVTVVAAPPALLQWGFDSLAVGNGGSVSVPVTLSRTDPGPVVVFLSSSDSMIGRPASSCPGGSLKRIQIPAGTASTSVVVCGVAAGRVTLVAQDSAGVFNPDTMVVSVVSTIEFREIGQFSRQSNFYANQNETHTAQVFLSDPAPAGGLGVTFVYGRPGTSTVTPSPAIIPGGQLSATVTIQGLSPGRDSIVPTSGGFVGKFSYVDVAANNLQISMPYPQAIGVGQTTTSPYVYYTYAMDHPLTVSLGLSNPIGSVPPNVVVPANNYYQYFTVTAFAPGSTYVNASASGWNATSSLIQFTTPQLGATGTSSMVAGDPTKGSWTAYTEDSIARYQHPVADTVFVTVMSRDTNVVAVDVGGGKVRPNQSSVSVLNALRAQPAAGGQSTWIVLSAPGYRPDSFQVNVTAPALTFQPNYPNQVLVGGQFQSAGYVQIPYARPDSFTVVFAHSNRGIVSGPDSVTIPKGSTLVYYDIVGDTVGHDSISIARATGYSIPPGHAFDVVPLHVSIYTQPTTLYTISRPQLVSVYVRQSVYPNYTNPLVAPLRVNLASSDTAAFKLDSAAVTIAAGAYISSYDTLRVNPASAGNDSGRVLISAAGTTDDSSNVIRVLPTPLTLNVAYPQEAGYRLKLQNGYVSIPDQAPDTVTVALTRRLPAIDSLSTFTVKIPKGQSYSSYFDFIALDSTGTDTVTATATGYVTDGKPASDVPAQIDVQDIGSTHLTTEPPVLVTTYLRMRPYPYYTQNAMDTVRFAIRSTDSSVIQIDSAESVSPALGSGTAAVPRDQYYGRFRVRFVGSGTARVVVSAPGFGTDTMAPVTVSGPVLHLAYQNLTVGVGQVYQGEYVSVDNPVTGSPLVVTLSKSDSALPAASQAFLLSATAVTIPVGQSYSPAFEITGQSVASAALVARATGYGQASTTIQVGAPQLSVPSSLPLHVGQDSQPINVIAQDQNGASRIVANPLVVNQTVSDPSVAIGDSATRTIASGAYYTTFTFKPLQSGSVSAIFTAPGYKPDTMTVAVDTAQLTFGSVPTTIGPGQTAQMYVSVPFANAAPVVVNLGTSPAGVISVPVAETIPAHAGAVYFYVTGVASGTAHVNGTAIIARPATSSDIVVGQPKLQLSFASSTNAGQKYTLTVQALDSAGNSRSVASPLSVTLVSSDPTHTTFDSSTVTIPVGSYYAQTGVTFTQAGSYTISGNATGYVSGNVSSSATGALVVISGSAFAPANVTINAGQTVMWRNNDALTHTTTSDTGLWDSGNLGTGNTYQRTFSTTGSFTYHCTIHSFMTATVTVQP